MNNSLQQKVNSVISSGRRPRLASFPDGIFPPPGGIDNRILTLFGTVMHETVQPLVQTIHSINQFDDEQEMRLNSYERKPIYILINSPGGQVETGLSLVTSILNSRTPIITYTLGTAMSMAFIIHVCGHVRIATKESIFMYHQISGGSYGSIEDIKGDVKYMDLLENMVNEIISENTYITKEKLLDINKQKDNWYIRHEEASKLGIYDMLIQETEEDLKQYISPETSIEGEQHIVIQKNKIKKLQEKIDKKTDKANKVDPDKGQVGETKKKTQYKKRRTSKVPKKVQE